MRDAFDSLGELRDRPAGVLRLNVPRMGHQHVLAPKLAAFMAQYPTSASTSALGFEVAVNGRLRRSARKESR